ncbi:hypothetical protein BB560_003616 [Smittium megazygosporum]|uniref:Uncharacterized protein n=1 Tax=Smittium megazygosporum TaxID=133381 RepID=A0A2T9ZBK3_9FUNG|nr:hypothetical protein BB560_003616 [Smittium megazygosporum]
MSVRTRIYDVAQKVVSSALIGVSVYAFGLLSYSVYRNYKIKYLTPPSDIPKPSNEPPSNE